MKSCSLILMLLTKTFHLGCGWNGNHVPHVAVIRQGEIGVNRAAKYPTALAAIGHPGASRHFTLVQRCLQTPKPGIRTFGGGNYYVRARSVVLRETERGGRTNEDDDPDDPDEETTTSRPPSLYGRVKGYFLRDKKDDGLTFRQRLAKMGVATVLSYGMISNLSYAILIAIAWYAFAAKTKLSPLAPGQWKPFLGVYAGFWVFNNVIRPLRVGLSIAIAPSLDELVLSFQNRLKISKPLAITVTVVFVNVIGTTLLMVGGITLASIMAGVPIYPPRGVA